MSSRGTRIRRKLAKIWGDVCVLCGRSFWGQLPRTIEHLTPTSLGGLNGENLALAHLHCNSKRGNESLIRAMQRLEAMPPLTVRRHERRQTIQAGALTPREW